MTKDLKFLVKIVKQASKLITQNFQVKEKDDKGDLVTSLDLEIEKFLIAKIKKQYPNFDIVSEETNNQEKLSENCFTIDPIDGTINFANGLPLWGIQVALVKGGETCAAVIFLPELNELYCADQTGAYLNKKPIHVSSKSPDRALYNANQDFRSEKENLRYRREFYCSVIFFPWVASGRLGANIFSKKTKSWDVVPGIYIAKQAGAVYAENDRFRIVANSMETVKYFEKLFK